MRLRSNSFISSTLALLFSGCSQIVPNAEVCADKGWMGAKCAMTRGPEQRNLKKLEWDKERVGYFCMDAKNYGKYQKFISDACANQQNCKDEVEAFVKKLQAPGGKK